MKIIHSIVVLALCLFGLSCNKQPQFVIKGNVKTADGSILYLEKRGLTDVIVLDSIKLDSGGDYVFEQPVIATPELYILRLDGQIINLAVDSSEVVTVNSDKKTFAANYEVIDSYKNSQIKEVTLAVNDLAQQLNVLKKKYADKQISDNDFLEQAQTLITVYKKQATTIILSDLKSITAYFTLFQKVGDQLIFDPYEKDDSKIFGAVATSWDTFHKDSPRAIHLRDYTLNAIHTRRKSEAEVGLLNNVNTASSEYYNINLPNTTGVDTQLASLKGKVVLLSFTAYQADYSPEYNAYLNSIYKKNYSILEIYQVSLDTDKHFWLNAAVNLPWICVRDSKGVNSELVSKFNIQALPTTYLIDKEGELVKRLGVGENIDAEIKKLL